MKNVKIGFIGAGNMAQALIGGLHQARVPAANLYASDSDTNKLRTLQKRLGIQITEDNQDLLNACDVVVLAVKPQTMATVVKSLVVPDKPCLFISIAAGITTACLQKWFGEPVSIVRTMPNTPAMVQVGATGMYADQQVSAEQRKIAESIMAAVGLVVWVEQESQLDAVTAVSGSGPAYFFYLMQAMAEAGTELGLAPEVALKLTLQTALGAATLANGVHEDPATLRQRVTSPGGTTEAAIKHLQSSHASDMIKQALRAASLRSAELAKKLEDMA